MDCASAGVCEYHVEQATTAVQSSWKNESAGAMAIILYDPQYREDHAVWKDSGVGIIDKMLH